MTINDSTTRRLVFAKYLQRLGRDQANLPEPMCAAAILTLHDATELLLQIAAEHLNVGGKKTDFMEYLGFIDGALAPRRLDGRESLRRMNSARVALKHQGTMPARGDAKDFAVVVDAFFRSTIPVVFEVSFESITLASLVAAPEVQTCLDRADQALAADDFPDALAASGEAFARLVQLYRPGDAWYRDIQAADHALLALLRTAPDDAREVKRLVTAIELIGDEVSLLKLGLDTRRYALFKTLTPMVLVESGNARISWRGAPSGAADAAHFCFGFVLDAALEIQELPLPAKERIGGDGR